ncbi:MAG: response regulator [Acidobacteriota bacterium]
MTENRRVLLVEDDKVDALTVKRAFRELGMEGQLTTVTDGEAALEYLEDPANERPQMILLDLNMPRMNGIEFLFARRKRPNLRTIPVIVLTTSSEEEDRVNTYNLCVAGYIIKPVDYRHFVDAIKTIESYWSLSLSST